jgi:hypothetical protein
MQLDEEAVRQVLARAVELERQHGGSLTEAQVREIARELSIPPAAIDQALAEYRSGVGRPIAVRTTARQWRPHVVLAVIVGIALVGMALAVVTVRIPVTPP